MNADYVIVGAGSAGCALAYRLSEAGHRVLVIEHGGTDMGPFIQMPAALSYPMNMSLYDWGYKSEPEQHLGGRELVCPRGKVIGGSSSIPPGSPTTCYLAFVFVMICCSVIGMFAFAVKN